MLLEKRGAVVTGGGRGIGAAVARALAEVGARVVVSARSTDQIESLAESLRQLGHKAWAVTCDVTDPDQVENLVQESTELLGSVDILINNAGIASSAPLKAISLEDWERIMAVNVTGPFLCTQAFIPAMIDAGWGRVVNVASVAGKVGQPYIAAYCASKHALIGFTRAVAAEMAAKGVTVNAVCPGYVDTPMTDESVANMTSKTSLSGPAAREYLENLSPQGRLMEPEEVAHLVVSLCSPLAKGITGQAVVLDGGSVQS
jgi:3-hydroxybutyrate dehydrogenase